MCSIRRRSIAAVLISFLCLNCSVRAQTPHPCLFAPSGDRDAILAKIRDYPWANRAYETLKDQVDRYVAYTQSDPQWMTSRLLMNWQTHYEIPQVRKERWIGGIGTAPVPTPRFAGARDWVTHFHVPSNLKDFRPFNDNQGQIYLIDDRIGRAVWCDPGQTGRTIEVANARILQLAANAGFVYWLTGDQKYAKFGSDILWTYLHGFSYVQLPHDLSNPCNSIIGMSSFEVIHEDSMLPLGEAYDFLHDFIESHPPEGQSGPDAIALIAAQLKRLADRVIDGGNAVGNWNLNQAKEIAPATIVLDEDSSYPDHKGREYYVNVLLDARLPRQTGISPVLREGYDQKTGIWPEAPGYGFGVSPQILQIASYLASTAEGRRALDDPILTKAILAPLELLYPNGWSIGMGDTDNTRVSSVGLELLIAQARKENRRDLESRLAAVLKREIAAGFWNRAAQADIPSITQYVGDLLPVAAEVQPPSRTFFGPPLNVVMQRNGADLAAAMYGSEGGHAQANGLNMELYGAGLILGADPGRGSSYWQPDHRDYYSQPPAHNTVIVNARSTYPPQGPGHLSLVLDAMEPQSDMPADSPNITFAECSFRYPRIPAQQQRTLALVHIGSGEGFYFEVFRSRTTSGSAGFHDYLYHDIGHDFSLSDEQGQPLPLASSHLLGSDHGDLPGYDFFKDEQSLDYSRDIHAQFIATMPNGSQHCMDAWMLGEPNRRVFALTAPPDHAGRESLPAELNSIPMPTLLVRQNGDAWEKPFVCVYEPHLGASSGDIQSVRAVNADNGSSAAACVVEGKSGWNAILAQDDNPTAPRTISATVNFQATFAAVIHHADTSELYLGNGISLSDGSQSIHSKDSTPISADLRKTDAGWVYSASSPVQITISGNRYDLGPAIDAEVRP